MKNNIVRKTGIRLMGIAAAMCSTFSFNPIGISYFAAVYMENEEKIWIFPISIKIHNDNDSIRHYL